MDVIEALRGIAGKANVLTGKEAEAYGRDWTGKYAAAPLAVVRPGDAQQVSAVMRLANETGTPVVPVSGNTSLAGGTHAEASILLSLDRMTRIREIRKEARIAIVEAGVILSDLHDAANAEGLSFPMTFGARGSARIGGLLGTNAGGSNVVRYGNTRDLCLGLEVVLPTGEVMDLMSELHKDNSGYNLKHLLIGAEGTLGIVTAAVLKLVPQPCAYATAMVAAPSLADALVLLNRLQQATGGKVEAFEYMPRRYMEAYAALHPEIRPPFEAMHDVNLLVEIGSTIPADAQPDDSGAVPLTAALETILAELFEQGAVLDAAVAQNEAQRRAMWARREAAAEVTLDRRPCITSDVAVPLDKVALFLERADAALHAVDPGAEPMCVAHLGDGNVHYSVWPSRDDAALHDAITETIEDVVLGLRGSFSAEHGIGLSKKPSMARRKDKVALAAMRAIKAALDPNNVLNPGKVLPD